ncbi:MAG: 50S ribosomal protein L24 [Candidatus Bathyarchaeia archaeon]|nr:50S ribosomal protein L24 [Candidatus Bathyarchaeota archaeon]
MVKNIPGSKRKTQRRRFFEAPIHRIRRMMSAPLSDELREKYNVRSFPVHKGDTVKVLRGDYKGVTGTVVRVDYGKRRIYVDGVVRQKASGETVHVPIHPSKVMIVKLNLDDKRRVEALERASKIKMVVGG